jgi:hypothetical protein
MNLFTQLVTFAILLTFPVATAQNQTDQSQAGSIGWQQEPSNRGTWSIIWSCLSLLYICVWAVLRPDVKDNKVRSKIFFSFVGLIAPEGFCAVAAEDFNVAFAWKKWIKSQNGIRGSQEWTLRHSFLCATGAVVQCLGHGNDFNNPSANSPSCRNYHLAPGEHQAVYMKGITKYVEKFGELPFAVKASQIKEWSKTNGLVTALYILQSTWMAVQCLVRISQGLQISLLELITLAYIPITLATFILWHRKPDMSVPYIYLQPKPELPDLAKDDRGNWFTPDDMPDLPNSRHTKFGQLQHLTCLSLGLPGLVFCGLHLCAWNYGFPSQMEGILWKVCSLVSIASLIIFVFLSGGPGTTLRQVLSLSSLLTYTICRLTLIVLAFMSLRSLPASVYQTIRWTQYFPHLA